MSFIITNADITAYRESLGFLAPTPATLRLIGIRGVTINADGSLSLNDNDPNIYNDAVGVWGTEFALFEATVDPGIANSPNPYGLAHLAGLEDGGRPWKFVHGSHHGQYPCLIQGEPVLVHRKERPNDIGMFAIEIHHGGAGDVVNNWSEGCQVIRYINGDWERFMGYVNASGQSSFEYTLINGYEFAKWKGLI